MTNGLHRMAVAGFLAALFGCGAGASAPAAETLNFVESIALPGVEGRIDHMALGAAGKRLFVAALGNNTVEVVDLAAHKVVQSIRGLREPQGVAYLKGLDRLAVANGDDGSVRLFDRKSYRPSEVFGFESDADNLRYDATKQRLYVGFGDGAIGVIDAEGKKRLGDIKLAAHPESFQLEAKGPRIYVNVPKAGHVAVIDREKSTVIAKWSIKAAAANFPMALDEPNRRLFIGCRQPARLLVVDTETGETIATIPIVGGTDDVFYDATAKHVYVSGGDGAVTVVSQENPNTYKVTGRVSTEPGARTSFFDQDSRMLYVAVPHRGKQQAELRVFKAR